MQSKQQYLMGNSPEDESAALEAHLFVCARCRTRIVKTEAYLSSMRHVAGEIRRRADKRIERGWEISRLLQAIAALACVLLLGILAVRFNRPTIELRLLAGTRASAPAGKGLQLRPDLSGPARGLEWRLEIVDASGRPSWRGAVQPGHGAAVPPQRAGGYVVKVYSRAGEMLRAFRLDIR